MQRMAFSIAVSLFLTSTIVFVVFFRSPFASISRYAGSLDTFRPPFGSIRNQAGTPDSIVNNESEEATTPTTFQGSIYDVFNSTLGLQEVILISLPKRRDKRDAFAVQAHLTNITYSVKDGVIADDLSKVELPHTMDQPPNVAACWRAHLDIYSHMLEHNIATAAILEDDVDWDVSLKQQLLRFARGSRYITGVPYSTKSPSPYGQGWDFLQIGHCSSQTSPDDHRRFVVSHDPTVIPPSARQQLSKPDMRVWEEEPTADTQTRIVFRNSQTVCTYAYLISAQGAAKALQHMSMDPFNAPIDLGLDEMCRDPRNTCIASYPPLLAVGRPAGSTNKGSDINNQTSEAVWDQPSSTGLMFSTKLNVDRLLKGEKVMGHYPRPNGDKWLLDVNEIGQLMGHGEEVEVEQLRTV